MVGIPDPERRLKSFPHEMSGGMAQRVMIAMALACEPELLIADEPTTALDVTIQAQILDLMRNLRDETGTAIILITHDLGVVAEMCDRVAVMYAGEIVEQTDVASLFREPLHPYTQGLIGSIPVVGRVKDELAVIPGNVPNLIDLPQGCRFAPRCAAADRGGRRASPTSVHPELRPVGHGPRVRCWLYHDAGRQRPDAAAGDAGRAADAGDAHRRVAASRAATRAPAVAGRMADGAAPPAAGTPARRGPRPGQALPDPRRRSCSARSAMVQAVDGVELRHPPRRDARPRRRVGLRQDHGRPPAAAAHRADGGHDPLRRHRHHEAPGRGPQALPAADADHLPGPVLEPRPADADRRQHRRGPAHPRPRDARRAARQGRADDGPGRPPAVPRAPLPARVLRRPAPAHRDRPRARPRARPRRLRRAGVGARRLDPGPGAQPAQAAPARARPDLPVRRPQHGRRRAHQRPGRGHVPRPHRRAGRPARRCSAQQEHPYTQALMSAIPVPGPGRCAASGSSCAATCRARSTRRPAAASTRAARCASSSATRRSAPTRCRRCCRARDEHLVACHFRGEASARRRPRERTRGGTSRRVAAAESPRRVWPSGPRPRASRGLRQVVV